MFASCYLEVAATYQLVAKSICSRFTFLSSGNPLAIANLICLSCIRCLVISCMTRPLGDLGHQRYSLERIFTLRDALLTRDVR